VRSFNLSSAGFAADSEFQFGAGDHGLRVREVPISACYQDEPKRPVWSHGLRVLSGLACVAGRYRPLLFFGGLGILVSLIGLALGLRSVNSDDEHGILGTGPALIGISLLELGSQALFTGVILHSFRALLIEFEHRDDG
jgi:hypothetical protein